MRSHAKRGNEKKSYVTLSFSFCCRLVDRSEKLFYFFSLNIIITFVIDVMVYIKTG